MRRSIYPIQICLSLGLLIWSSGLHGQTNIEANASLQLNLSQPGARSLGMGGAFIGLADDATAAYTNPAGLANLSAAEVTFEGRGWNFNTTYTDDGTASFSGNNIDASNLIEGEAESSTGGYSYGAITVPWKSWVFSLYRHQLADYEVSFDTRGASGDSFSLFLARASTALQIEGTGLAVAVPVSNSFSLGLGITSYTYDWNITTRRFRSQSSRDRNFWVNEQGATGTFDGEEEKETTASVGFELKLTERWRLGGVYRRGPEFAFSSSNTLGPDNGSQRVFHRNSGTFKVPDVIGFGIAYKSTSFRVLADWVHVKYSQLAENTVDVFGDPDAAAAARNLLMDDVDELHLGFEYVFVDLDNPIAVRVGGWLDPDHRLRYEGPLDTADQRADAIIFRPGDDQVHLSAGVGVSLYGGRLELNLAADVSEDTDTASASLTWRFF